MIDTWQKYLLFLIIQIVIICIWLIESKSLKLKYRLFWLVDLLIFFGSLDLTTKCNLENRLDCLGLAIIFSTPLFISGIFLILGLIFKIASIFNKKLPKNVQSPSLPGPTWLWFIIVLVLGMLLTKALSNLRI